jgi:hypothetical protein
MKRVVMYAAVILVVFSVSFSACSKKEEAEPEKGKIDKMTDQAADAIVTRIRTPINQARSTKEAEEERMKALDETLKDQ